MFASGPFHQLIAGVFLAIFLFFSPVSDLTFASGSAATANVSSRVPVVMVVFDEASTIAFEDAQERIDPVLYPNLAALARDATWFRYATAATDMTGTATPTILTGSIAERYHPPILSSYPHNLFTLLGRRYRMKVSQEATDLCPRDLCEDASGESAAARDRALASDLGLVYYKHSLLPHVPFQYFPDGHRYRKQPHDVIPGLTDAPSRGQRLPARAGLPAASAAGGLCRPIDRHAAAPLEGEAPLVWNLAAALVWLDRHRPRARRGCRAAALASSSRAFRSPPVSFPLRLRDVALRPQSVAVVEAGHGCALAARPVRRRPRPLSGVRSYPRAGASATPV